MGDYSCEFIDGSVPPVVFERKSITDLFGTLGDGYERFKRELFRAKENGTKIILIIEGHIPKVLAGNPYSTKKVKIKGKTRIVKLNMAERKKHGKAKFRQILTLSLKYGLNHIFCKDRDEMSMYIAEYYSAVGRLKQSKG